MRIILFYLLVCCASAQDAPEIAGIAVTPHTTTAETRYHGRSVPRGAWVQIIFRNPGPRPLPAPNLVNGREPFQWLLTGEWSWMDAPRLIPANGYAVLSFNGITPEWRPGARILLENRRRSWRAELTLPQGPVSLSRVSFLPRSNLIAVHFLNDSTAAVRLESVTLHTGPRFDQPVPVASSFSAVAAPGDRGAALFLARELPSGYTLIEASFNNNVKQWSLLRIKDDAFDIGAGWLDTRAPNGRNPLEIPLFRSLLRRLHINLTHSERDPAPDGQPFRRMSTFADIKKFSVPAEAASIHCADVVGEPQHSGLTPWDVFRRLEPYRAGSYPTCLTLSEDLGFGFYAGLSDWPHFDAYRVNAPHADDWAGYERFGGLVWGAPLESTGAMMRVLRQVSRPRPVAAWSQSAHYNWRFPMGGRSRLDPTPGEMALQAWQVIANGAQSLYWYSLESYSALRSPDLLQPTAEIGRLIRLLDEFLETGDASWHDRRSLFDLNVIAAPEAAILFAMDLDYRPDHESKTFVWPAPRTLDEEFHLPQWLRGAGLEVLRVTPAAVEPVPFEASSNGLRLRASVSGTALHIATKNKELSKRLKQKLEMLMAREAAESFDPAGPGHLDALAAALGYARNLR